MTNIHKINDAAIRKFDNIVVNGYVFENVTF